MSLKPHPPAGPPPRHLSKRAIPKKQAMLTGPLPPWKRAAPSPSPPPSPAARPTAWPVKKRDQYTHLHNPATVHRQPGCEYNSAAQPGSASDARHGSGSGSGARHAIGARPGARHAIGARPIVDQKCEQRSNAQQLAYCSDVRQTRFIRRHTRSARQPADSSHADHQSIECEQPTRTTYVAQSATNASSVNSQRGHCSQVWHTFTCQKSLKKILKKAKCILAQSKDFGKPWGSVQTSSI